MAFPKSRLSKHEIPRTGFEPASIPLYAICLEGSAITGAKTVSLNIQQIQIQVNIIL